MSRLLVGLLCILIVVVSGVLGAFRTSRYTRYTRYTRHTRYTRYTGYTSTYHNSSSSAGLIGGVVGGIFGAIILGIAIFFLVKYCKKNRQRRPQRPIAKYSSPSDHTGTNPTVQLPEGPGQVYNNPDPPPPGLNPSFYPPTPEPPPPYTQAVPRQGFGGPPASDPAYPPAPGMGVNNSSHHI